MRPTVPTPTSVVEAAKRLAAWTAVDRHILPEHKVRRYVSNIHVVLLVFNPVRRAKVIGIGSGRALSVVHRTMYADYPPVLIRLDRPLCGRAHRRAGQGGQQRPGLHPYWYVVSVSHTRA